MARKFVTQREVDLIDRLNKELIQDVAEQYIIYYAVDFETSMVHDVYDESIRKEYHQPVRVAARVEFQPLATETKAGHLDSKYQLEARVHADELRDRNLRPREGDFIEYGGIVYEITSAVTGQPVYGQIQNKLEIVLTCVPSREGQFKAENVTFENVDNTHPVETARPRTLGDDL
jgi:hypothetical protein